MGIRRITSGERTLLRSVFEETLPYGTLRVSPNDSNTGDVDNSITPGAVPFISTIIWCADFSDKSISDSTRSTFIHEFTHVWQYYHGETKLSAIWLAVRHLGDYSLAYPYDLSDSDDILDYNIEQQAAIIEDWWLITKGMCRSTTLVGTRVCHLTPLTSIRCGAWDRRQYRQYRDIGAFDRLKIVRYGGGAAMYQNHLR